MSAIGMYDAGDLGWTAEDRRLCKPTSVSPRRCLFGPLHHFNLLEDAQYEACLCVFRLTHNAMGFGSENHRTVEYWFETPMTPYDQKDILYPTSTFPTPSIHIRSLCRFMSQTIVSSLQLESR
jgi:hypothetical protein